MFTGFKISTLVLICTSGLFAQEGQLGINFLFGQPKGEFKDNVDEFGFGLGAMAAYRPGTSPFLFGLDINYVLYGNESRNVPFSQTIPDVTVEVETSNNILILQGLLRLQGNQGFFRPYLDGFAGINYLFTETKIRDEDDFFDEGEIASSTNQQDVALSYGGGGGLMIQVYSNPDVDNFDGEDETDLGGVLIDFRIRYSLGGQATYLKKGSITREEGDVIIDQIVSNTDILTYQLGVVFQF